MDFHKKQFKKKSTSNILENSRNIKIYLPKGYEKDSLKNYPLTIVLDAEYLFDTYVGNSVLFALKDKSPKQIIVGIPMKNTKKKTPILTVTMVSFMKVILLFTSL